MIVRSKSHIFKGSIAMPGVVGAPTSSSGPIARRRLSRAESTRGPWPAAIPRTDQCKAQKGGEWPLLKIDAVGMTLQCPQRTTTARRRSSEARGIGPSCVLTNGPNTSLPGDFSTSPTRVYAQERALEALLPFFFLFFALVPGPSFFRPRMCSTALLIEPQFFTNAIICFEVIFSFRA
jgi:hypothetical protein